MLTAGDDAIRISHGRTPAAAARAPMVADWSGS
jgi:hypothetical protein